MEQVRAALFDAQTFPKNIFTSLSPPSFSQICGGDKPYISPAELERRHTELLQTSVRHFRSVKKMGGEDFCRRYQEQLEAELNESYTNFTKHNDGKNIFFAARTPAMLFAVMFVMYVVSLVTGFVGISYVAVLCNLVMGVALTALCIWAYVKYSGKFRDVGRVIDIVAETLWEQVRWNVKSLICFIVALNVKPTAFTGNLAEDRLSLAPKHPQCFRFKITRVVQLFEQVLPVAA